MFPHIKGERCQLCGLPITLVPDISALYSCSGCGRSFVRQKRGWVTIEKYLDPDDLLQLEDFKGFSPQIQQLLKDEETRMERATQMTLRGGAEVTHFEVYKPWAEYGMYCFQSDRNEEALFCLVKVLHDFYFNWGTWLEIAQICANFLLFDIAERAIGLVEIADPSFEPLSRISSRLRQFHKEIDKEQRRYSDDLRLSLSYQRLVNDALISGNLTRAIIRARQAISLVPTDPDLWASLGGLYVQEDNVKFAKSALDKAIELDPKNATAYFNYTSVYMQEENLGKAIEMAKKAAALDPQNLRFRNKVRELESL